MHVSLYPYGTNSAKYTKICRSFICSVFNDALSITKATVVLNNRVMRDAR
jgi:hypothetical protein